jgi:nitroimidazol reductase NimA-like FMN-containing flavoprotein (pyridoxamine 5'-phosphate oxidase superfamily)
MSPHTRPIVRALRGDEAEALLERSHLGRLAFSLHDRVDVEPIHYVYDAPWIFGRTSPGTKLLTLAHHQWCAFEVDEVRGQFDWDSVVVKGPFCPQGSPLANWEPARALAALRRFIPESFTSADPTPHRNILFGIHASEMSGRCSISPDLRLRRGAA